MFKKKSAENLRFPYITNHVIEQVSKSPSLRYTFFRLYNAALKRLYRRRLAKTFYGASMQCDLKDYVQRMIFNFGFWEPNISAYISQFLRRGDIFLDIGSNVGYDTLLGASLVGIHGRVISVEASKRTFDILSTNVELNAYRNVRLINAAVAEEPGSIELFCPSEASLGETTTLRGRQFISIGFAEAVTLDQLLDGENTCRIRLIKMDIEGAEAPIMRAIIALLDRFSKELEMVVEISPSDAANSWVSIFDQLACLGFNCYVFENEYDARWYFNWKEPRSPTRIHALPSRQCDVVFTRRLMQ